MPLDQGKPPWWSHGCEHGSRSHRIAPDGSVRERVDLALESKYHVRAVDDA